MRKLNLVKFRMFFERDFKGKVRSIREWIRGAYDPYLSFTVSTPCPMKCNCCPWEVYQKASEHLNRNMSLEDFKTILGHVPKNVVVDFSGFTESAVNPEMPDMAVYAYQQGYHVQVFTTLVGLSDEGMAKLATIKPDKFVVHVPDKTNTLYDPEKWLKILARFRKHKIGCIVYGALGEVDERIVKALRGEPFFTSYVFDKGDMRYEGARPRTGKLRCSFNYSGLNLDQNCVNVNGDLCICPMDYQLEVVMGNLKDHTYSVLTGAGFIDNFRRRMLTENEPVLCRKCPYAVPINVLKDARYEHKWRGK